MKRDREIKRENPPDELAQNVSKKSLSDEPFLIFFEVQKVQILTVCSNMIRIRFYGLRELIQRHFSDAQCVRLPKKSERSICQGQHGRSSFAWICQRCWTHWCNAGVCRENTFTYKGCWCKAPERHGTMTSGGSRCWRRKRKSRCGQL